MSEPGGKPLLATTWAELRRRKVVRVAIGYALVAWIVLQLGEITFEPLGFPPRALTWTILVAILGFPVVLVLAWVFDHDQDGLRRDTAAGALRGPARLFAVLLVLVTVAALAWWLTGVYRDDAVDVDSDASVGSATGDSPAPAAGTAAAPWSPPPNSIAVLPFDDMSAEGDQAWFADGLAEELLERLARTEGLRVAARTSSFALRGSALDVAGIGRALNVATVLEGSVRKADGLIRVTVQLIDTGNGYHLWAETYERADAGIFELQDELTTDIVGNLRERLPGVAVARPDATERATTGAAVTGDVQAHEWYLQGRLHWRRRTPDSLDRAGTLFRQALELDPGYARAWSGLADTYLLLGDYGVMGTAQAVAQAEPAVVRALDLAPGLGEAWASLGLLRMLAGQLDAAEGNLREAIRLDPGYEMAYMWLGGLYARQGRLQAQADVLEQAHRISPLDPAINVNLAGLRAARGDPESARSLLRSLLATTPDAPMVQSTLAEIERGGGRLVEALQLADPLWRQDPGIPAATGALANVLAALGRFDDASAVAATLPGDLVLRPLLLHSVAAQRDRAAPLPADLEALADRLLADPQTPADEALPLLQMAATSAYWNGDRERSLQLLLRALLPRHQDRGALLQDEVNLAGLAAFALRDAGRDGEAQGWHRRLRQTCAQLRDQGWTGPYADYTEATLDLFEGDLDGASAGIARAVAGGFSELWILDGDPRLEALRGRPEFERVRGGLLHRIEQQRARAAGFTGYQSAAD